MRKPRAPEAVALAAIVLIVLAALFGVYVDSAYHVLDCP